MVNTEAQRSQGEIWGTRARNGGIVAGLIGLIARSAGLLAGGIGLIVSGEILANNGKKLQQKRS